MLSRLITGIAVTLLLVACVAVVITTQDGRDAADGTVDLATDESSQPAEPGSSTASSARTRWPVDGSGSTPPELAAPEVGLVGGVSGAGEGDGGATSRNASGPGESGNADVAGADDAPTGATSPSTEPATPSSSSTSTTASPQPQPSPKPEPSSSTTSTTATSTAQLAVFGVAYNDVLNVRTGPGSSNPVVLGLASTEGGVAALGDSRTLSDATLWYDVQARGVSGWAAARYLLHRGPTRDVTSQVVAKAGGNPEAADMSQLGQSVARLLGTASSRLVLSVAPSGSDPGQVVYDVVGLGSSSIGGLRVKVLGAPTANGFSLRTVETTDFCLRGGSPSRGCA